MEALEKEHDPLMGFYFSCSHCQQKYVSAECVQEHWTTCQMQSSSFMMPQIRSYSSLNPQAFDRNFDSGGFPIQHEIIKKEPEDYMEDDYIDWQDETEDSSLSRPADIQKALYPYSPNRLQERVTRRKATVPFDSLDTEEDSGWTNPSEGVPNLQRAARSLSKILRETLKNPHSTCTEDRYSCRYCPRTFPYPSSVLVHEGSHTREPKYSCPTCGERFGHPHALEKHMKSHEPHPGFPCRYPGCPETFHSKTKRWSHHQTHPRDWWNEYRRRPRQLGKNHKSNTVPAVTMSAQLATGNKRINNPPTTDQIDKSQNARKGNSRNSRKSQGPAQTVSCLFPGCPKTFTSTFKRWIHHKTHPKGRWNRAGRRPGWNLPQNQKTALMPPKLSPVNENFPDNESMESPSMPDLSLEVPMTHSETKPELKILQQSAVNDATTSQESRGPNNPTVRKRGRPAKPGHEIEIMTAWGRKFKCDLCDKMFPARTVVRNHRWSHFDEPQFPCYITGCSELFFSRVQRVKHLKLVHAIRFRKGKPFIGATRVAVNITGPRNIVAKAIVSNVKTARQPSQAPQKMQPKASPKSDQNAPRGSRIGGLNSGRTELFPCGLCDGSFDNLDILKYHMLRIHRGSEESQGTEIDTPAESMETLSVPDVNTEGRMTHSETKSINNVEFKNVRQSAVSDATTNQESRGPSCPLTTRRSSRPAQPGDEIEIMTACGRKFKCDLCDKLYLSRMVARDHRLSHFEKPQISCYVKGCSERFFSRVGRVNHLESVHHVVFRKGKPFIGSSGLALKTTGPRKVIAKEIIPHVKTAQLPSQSPPKIQPSGNPKSDQNIPRGSERGLLSPGKTLLFTCGICGNSFENLHALKCHMFRTHAGPEASQAEGLEEISTPVDSSFQSVQSKGDRIRLEVKQNKSTSNLPRKNLNARIKRKDLLLRYPIVTAGGKKYFYCGFPGCDAVFSDRIKRYKHQKKFHDDAPRTMFTYLPDQLSQKTAHETSSKTLEETCDDEKKKTADRDSVPDFPVVQVNGKKYYWCDFPGCAIVTTSPEARYLHLKKHQMSSERRTMDQDPVRPDAKKRKIFHIVTKQLQMARPKIHERNEDELLSQTLPQNTLEIPEFSVQNDEEVPAQSLMPNDEEMPSQSIMQVDAGMPAQAPTQCLTGVLDQHFKADEQEMSADLQNQSTDPLQFFFPHHNYSMEHSSLLSEDFNAENITHTDSGLGSELSAEASSSVSNSALRNISNPSSWKIDEVLQGLPVVKERKSRGRKSLYPVIQFGSRKLFCCGVPGCKGVFKSRNVRDQHHKHHRMGKKVNSRLRLTEDGMVLHSTGGLYIPE